MRDLRFLLDQGVSPSHVARINALGLHAEHVAHVGLAGSSDAALMAYAFGRSLVIITKNVMDFLRLAASTSLHPGIVLLRDGELRIAEEWAWIEPVLRDLIAKSADPVNIVIDVRGPGLFTYLPIP